MLVQSPIPKMLLYLVCCSVSLLTDRNPAPSTRSGLELRQSGVDMGGVMWSMSYFTVSSCPLSRSSKMASLVSGFTSTRWLRSFTLMPRPFTTSHKASAYFFTPKMTGREVLYWMLALMPLFLQFSSARYMIFWGAPAHFIGELGKVKTAFPPLNSSIAFLVLST